MIGEKCLWDVLQIAMATSKSSRLRIWEICNRGTRVTGKLGRHSRLEVSHLRYLHSGDENRMSLKGVMHHYLILKESSIGIKPVHWHCRIAYFRSGHGFQLSPFIFARRAEQTRFDKPTPVRMQRESELFFVTPRWHHQLHINTCHLISAVWSRAITAGRKPVKPQDLLDAVLA